jgi:putative endonuclease
MECDHFFVYILASMSGTLYVGVTNDIKRRTAEHKAKINKGFTSTYGCVRLVYYEQFDDPMDAIARENALKHLKRSQKIDLIRKRNRMWFDLSRNWKLTEVTPYQD